MLTRRNLLAASVAAGLGTAESGSAMASSSPVASPLIDPDHPQIRTTAERIAAGAASPRERAVRLHDFVRDEVRFGWTRGFYDVSASAVLDRRRGYCVTKTTLMVALCRAAGLEARPVFVDIRAEVIADFIDPGTPYVDHSYAEIRLDGRWVATDSYIVSRRHLNAAQARLRRKSRSLGWGVHIDGTAEWDGRADGFSQFVDNGRVPAFRTRDPRPAPDIRAYLDTVDGWNEVPALIRAGFGLLAETANRRADSLATGTGTGTT